MFKILELLANLIIYKVLGLSASSKIAEGLFFFIFNILKVFILLLIIGFVVGIAREIITPEKTRKLLSNQKPGIGNILSSIIAVITPVESFSVVPVFIGFLEAGIPLSAAFTYLITAPMTNEVAFALFWGLFGYKVAFIYYAIGIIVGLVGGILIGFLKSEDHIQPFVFETREKYYSNLPKHKDFKTIVNNAIYNSIRFFKNFWFYIVLGVGIAALIQGYIPSYSIIKYVGIHNPFAIPIAVISVIFLYVNIAMALPIIMIFIANHLPIGTIMAFTLAVTATSIPELLVLKRALKSSLLLTYTAILFGLIILTGYVLNYFS